MNKSNMEYIDGRREDINRALRLLTLPQIEIKSKLEFRECVQTYGKIEEMIDKLKNLRGKHLEEFEYID